MKLTAEEVSDILLNNSNYPIVFKTDWSKIDNKNTQHCEFVIQKDVSFFKGKVSRTFNKQTKKITESKEDEENDSDSKDLKTDVPEVTYSHEPNGLELVAVGRRGVKRDGKRIVIYE